MTDGPSAESKDLIAGTIEPASSATSPGYVDASEPIHLGYAAGYFDEIQVTKPPFGSY